MVVIPFVGLLLGFEWEHLLSGITPQGENLEIKPERLQITGRAYFGVLGSHGVAEMSSRMKGTSRLKAKIFKSSNILFLFKLLGLGEEVGSARASYHNELKMKESRLGKIKISLESI